MGDGTATNGAAGAGREDARAPRDMVMMAAGVQTPGGEPPDVIEVVFPGSGRPGADAVASDAAGGRGGRHQEDAGRQRIRTQSLLLGSLAVTTVGLAAALAWQLWPQSPSAELTARPERIPAATSVGVPFLAPAATTNASAAPAGPRTLSAGDRGSDVRRLQLLLFARGFTAVSQNGVYDHATVLGVEEAQRNRGLTCDPPGVYGSCTRAALSRPY